jgi:hypothetical protein
MRQGNKQGTHASETELSETTVEESRRAIQA